MEMICSFKFTIGKSFRSLGVITVPSRHITALLEAGIDDGVPAQISFFDENPIAGSIRSGRRAGGRYFQICPGSVANFAASCGDKARLDAIVLVRVSKEDQDWSVNVV